MVVADIMTNKVLTVSRESRVDEAYRTMRDRHIRHLPVVDSSGALAGMVSDRDIRQILIPMAADQASSLPTEEAGPAPKSPKERQWSFQPTTVTVGEIMIENVFTVPPKTDVADAASLIYFQKIGSLPVVDDQGQMVGILTGKDLLGLLLKMLNTIGISVHIGVILGEDSRAFTKVAEILDKNYAEIVSVWITGAEYERAERVYHFQLAARDTNSIIAAIQEAGFTVVENGQVSQSSLLSA